MNEPIEELSTQPTIEDGKSRFQFSLRSLLELSVVFCLGCSLWAWGGDVITRAPEYFLGLIILLTICGIFMRRWAWILGAAVVFFGLFLGLASSLVQQEYNTKWHWESHSIVLQVLDSERNAPIKGADVQMTSGNHSPGKRTKTVTGTTSSDGCVALDVKIQICYFDRGYSFQVDPESLKDIELHIEARGYPVFHGWLSDYDQDFGPIDSHTFSSPKPIVFVFTKK